MFDTTLKYKILQTQTKQNKAEDFLMKIKLNNKKMINNNEKQNIWLFIREKQKKNQAKKTNRKKDEKLFLEKVFKRK